MSNEELLGGAVSDDILPDHGLFAPSGEFLVFRGVEVLQVTKIRTFWGDKIWAIGGENRSHVVETTLCSSGNS